MADFDISFKKGITIEGGYKLINIRGDRGKLTYAGISRSKHPYWLGWEKIDKNQFDIGLQDLVKLFYRKHFWNKILGDNINSQKVADAIYLSALNIGVRPAIKITQSIVNCTVDGIFGKITLKTLNDFIANNEKIFILSFQLLNIYRYKNICLHDKRRKNDKIVSNLKFLCGWINRVQQYAKD